MKIEDFIDSALADLPIVIDLDNLENKIIKEIYIATPIGDSSLDTVYSKYSDTAYLKNLKYVSEAELENAVFGFDLNKEMLRFTLFNLRQIIWHKNRIEGKLTKSVSSTSLIQSKYKNMEITEFDAIDELLNFGLSSAQITDLINSCGSSEWENDLKDFAEKILASQADNDSPDPRDLTFYKINMIDDWFREGVVKYAVREKTAGYVNSKNETDRLEIKFRIYNKPEFPEFLKLILFKEGIVWRIRY